MKIHVKSVIYKLVKFNKAYLLKHLLLLCASFSLFLRIILNDLVLITTCEKCGTRSNENIYGRRGDFAGLQADMRRTF